jgi:hypothetical protein
VVTWYVQISQGLVGGQSTKFRKIFVVSALSSKKSFCAKRRTGTGGY